MFWTSILDLQKEYLFSFYLQKYNEIEKQKMHVKFLLAIIYMHEGVLKSTQLDSLSKI